MVDHNDEVEAGWMDRRAKEQAEIEDRRKVAEDADESLRAYSAQQKELAASEKENAKDRDEERKKALKDQIQTTGGVSASSDARNMLQSAILTTKMDPDAANKKEQEEQTKRLKAIDDKGIKIRNVELFALGAPA